LKIGRIQSIAKHKAKSREEQSKPGRAEGMGMEWSEARFLQSKGQEEGRKEDLEEEA